jgi:BirA family biotin operon repressor/biotin-[acetyl-CoA-carboxylase] ligase
MTTAERLSARTRFERLVHVHACGSTQDLAADDPTPGWGVYWSDHQTAGRGREGREWNDEPGLDLALTFRVTVRLARPARLAPAVPVAVLEALERHSAMAFGFKWPNDVVHRGSKLAGILIDNVVAENASHFIGVGVNVNRARFPAELESHATSLALLTGRPTDREALMLDIAESIDRAIAQLEADSTQRLADLFADRLGLLARRVVAETSQGRVAGRLVGLDIDELVLDDSVRLPLAFVKRLGPE